MPASNLYTTKAIQDFLMKEIYAPIVKNFQTLQRKGVPVGSRHFGRVSRFFGILRAILELIQVARKMRKLPRPTHDNVNKHNSHVMVDLRDDFLAHDAPRGVRHQVYEGMFNLTIIKYEIDDHMSKRFDYWLRKWKETDWIFTGKHPETEWILNEADRNEPVVLRQKALLKALDNREFEKVLNLIE